MNLPVAETVLYELYDSRIMGCVVLIVRLFGVLCFGGLALATQMLHPWSLPIRALAFLIFGATASALAYRNLELLIRILFHRAILTATTSRLRVWDFLGYRDIPWSDFGEVMRIASAKGSDQLLVRYRPQKPTFLQKWMMRRSDGYASKRQLLSSVSAAAQSEIESRVKAARNVARRI
jgi:hypothetical protein